MRVKNINASQKLVVIAHLTIVKQQLWPIGFRLGVVVLNTRQTAVWHG